MAVFDYPELLMPQLMDFGSIKAGVSHQSPLNGSSESVEFPGARWRIGLTLPQAAARSKRAALAEGFFGRLAGGVHRVRMRHFLQPIPRGTMRGTPTVAVLAAWGAESIAIATSGTLLAGDFFKVGGQLCRAAEDCAPVAGVLTVPLVQRLRAQVNVGAAVVWDTPTFLAVYPSMSFAAAYGPGRAEGVQLDLVEVFS